MQIGKMRKTIKNYFNLILLILGIQFAFASPDWEDCPACYEFTATISGAVILNDGVQMGDDGDIFAAFDDDGNNRGIALQLSPPFGPYQGTPVFEMQMRSNAGGDHLTFKYYDASEDAVLDISEDYTFVINDIIGDVTDPWILNIGVPDITCETGYIPDCSNDGDCCSEYWVGDGLGDCTDQQWGCDLTCYNNDGGDCASATAGCTNLDACNYDTYATEDDGSCDIPAENYDCDGNCTVGYDCTGICGGSAVEDECGICQGENSPTTGICDCNSTPNGSAYFDNCGNCVAGNTGSEPCSYDCMGVWGGDAVIDDCGYCTGMLNLDIFSGSCYDCAGVPNGSAFLDGCGMCVGGNTGQSPCEYDCAGMWGGNAYFNECGVCICNGSYGNCVFTQVCIQDCAEVWGGYTAMDACGICGGDGSTCVDCWGTPNGDAVIDDCGNCVLPWDNSCMEGCDGNWKNDGSQMVEDGCGICGGDNSTCGGCTDGDACNYQSSVLWDDGSCLLPQGCNDWCEGDAEAFKEFGCDGICGSGVEYDVCGICGGSETDEANCDVDCDVGVEKDCTGTCGGSAYKDVCGVCAGNGSTCECDEFINVDGESYCQSDLEVLQMFIDNSSRFGSNQDHTLNLGLDGNGNNNIEPLELGNILWTDGRIEFWVCQNCGIMGEIPMEINNLSRLKNLDLSNNYLSGKIPDAFGDMINLDNIALQSNYFSSLSEGFTDFLEKIYQNNSGTYPNPLDFINTSLSGNTICEPLNRQAMEVFNLNLDDLHYVADQNCELGIFILYPQGGVIRYTGDTSIPVEIIVLNYEIGKQGEGTFDGQILYIIDNDMSEFGTGNSDKKYDTSFGIWGHSFGEHTLKIWLATHSYVPETNNAGEYILAEVSYSIMPGISGCTDPSACNFEVYAAGDDGSCEYEVDGCCLDACGDCDGDNGCIPEMLSISVPPESIIPIHGVNPELIELEFSQKITLDSREGVTISSLYDADWYINIGEDGDNGKMQIYLSNLTAGDEISISLQSDQIVAEGSDKFTMDKVYSDTTWNYTVTYLGDYNLSEENEGEPILDDDDINILINNWGGNDYGFELGPCENGPCQPQDVPNLKPAFDEKWDIEDLQTFVLMWNWSNQYAVRVQETIPQYGNSPGFTMEGNNAVMKLPEYNESVHHLWLQIQTAGKNLIFNLEGFYSHFDLALKRDFPEENTVEWSLVSLKGVPDLESIVLGTFPNQRRQGLNLAIQYKINTKMGLLSKGSTQLVYTSIPNNFKLSQPYPNPFNPIATVEYALQNNSEIVLSVYDIQGRLITCLAKGHKSAGYYEAVWNASNHASGMYFIRMNVYGLDNKLQFNKLQKIMLVK